MKLTDDEKRQKKLEYCKKYYREHKEKLNKYSIEFYYANRNEILAFKKRERQLGKTNRSKIKEWQVNNPEKCKSYSKKYYWDVTKVKLQAKKNES